MLNADWTIARRTLKEIRDYVGDSRLEVGWNVGDLPGVCLVVGTTSPVVGFRMFVWNDVDPRPEIRKLLDLPTHTFGALPKARNSRKLGG